MSRYWVFTEEQLAEALAQHETTWAGREAVLNFLNSDIAVSSGMARDIAAPAAPEIHVAEEPTL